jgi:hypothetical protein
VQPPTARSGRGLLRPGMPGRLGDQPAHQLRRVERVQAALAQLGQCLRQRQPSPYGRCKVVDRVRPQLPQLLQPLSRPMAHQRQRCVRRAEPEHGGNCEGLGHREADQHHHNARAATCPQQLACSDRFESGAAIRSETRLRTRRLGRHFACARPAVSGCQISSSPRPSVNPTMAPIRPPLPAIRAAAGSRCSRPARNVAWTTRSATVGTPSLRSLPPALGITTRRTSTGVNSPDFNESRMPPKNSSTPTQVSIQATVARSTPGVLARRSMPHAATRAPETPDHRQG